MKANKHFALPAAIAGLALTAASTPAQTINNPNFDPPAEDVSDNPTPGYGPISDWTSGVGVGINPSATNTKEFLGALDPPSGTHVAFMQSTRTISQAISGYDPAKLYTVTYLVNERGHTPVAATSTSVSLDGGATSYAQPGNIVRTSNFRRIVSGPLAVSGASSTLKINSTAISGDNTLLVDTVSITRAVPAVPDNGFENPVQADTDLNTRYKLAAGPGTGSLAGSLWDFQGTTNPAITSGISRNGSAFQSTLVLAPEGSQVAILRGTGEFSTTVDGFEAGVTYSLSFEANGRPGATLGPNEIQVQLDGTPIPIAGVSSITPPQGTWTSYTTEEVNTTGGSHVLKFVGLTTGDKTTFVDDIRFNFVAEAGAPSGELRITSVAKSGNTVTVGFEGVDGQSYDLNKSTTLDFTNLDIKDSVTLSGTTSGTLEDSSATEDKAFYRVEQQVTTPGG